MRLLIPAVGLLFLLLCGCDQQQRAPAQKPPEPPEAVPQGFSDPNKAVRVSDLFLRKSNEIPLGVDRRPTWILSGRFENQTSDFIETVWLEIHIWGGTPEEEEDSTVLKLTSLRIPPGGVVAFAQSVKLLPPREKWNFTVVVINAVTEPQ